MKKEFARHAIYSVAGYVVLILFSMGFSFYAARMLGATDYGVFATFFYFLIAFTQPINSFQLAVAKHIVYRNIPLARAEANISSTLFIFNLVILIAFVALSPLLKNVYHLPSIFEAIIGGFIVMVWVDLAGYRGVYQGEMYFKDYGINIGLEGILRAGLGVLMIAVGWGVGGALGASVVSGLIGIIVIIRQNIGSVVKSYFLFKLDREIFSEFLKAFAVLFPFGLIMSLDLTMVQKVIGGDPAGYISVCGLFGKNFIAASMIFANVIYSYTLKGKSDTFWVGVFVTIIILTAAVFFFIFIADPLIYLLFGSAYAPVSGYLPWYILATIPVAVLQHIVNYTVAKDFSLIKVLMWGILLFLIPVYYFILIHFSLITFLILSFVIVMVIDGVLLIIIAITKKVSK